MSKLKDLTWQHHKTAERQQFAKVLISGNIHPEKYAIYLYNQASKYIALEQAADAHNLYTTVGSIRRASRILNDFAELWPHSTTPQLLPSTGQYVQHMIDIQHDVNSVIAHMYVFYMGELSGGQLIKKRVPGTATMYDFGVDVDQVKTAIRSLCNDSMALEAQWAFTSATALFQEMMEVPGELYLGQAD